MIQRSAFSGGNVPRPNQWTYFSEGIDTVNQSRVSRHLLPMAMAGRIIGMTPIPTLSPARSRRIIWSLIVLMAAMVASQNRLRQWQSEGGPSSHKLPLRSELTVQPILPVQRRLVPGPCTGHEIASQNPLPQRQSRGCPWCHKLPVRSEPTVSPKLPVRRRLVVWPHDRRKIEVG